MSEQQFTIASTVHFAAADSVPPGNLVAGIIIGLLFAIGCLIYIITWRKERKSQALPQSLKDALDISLAVSFIGVPVGLAVAIKSALLLL